MRILATTLFILAAFAGPAPRAAEVRTIGVLCHCGNEFPTLQAFEKGLAELGLRDSDTLKIVRRASGGNAMRLATQAQELVSLKPDVIFAGFTPAVIAIQKLTSSIPVVFAGVSDAVEIGAAGQLARPDRNFTGAITINRELMPKRMELLKLALPALSSMGYLANPRYGLHAPQLQDMTAEAARLGIAFVVAEATEPEGIEGAFAELKRRGVQALVVQQDPLFTGQPQRIIALAAQNRLPAIYPLRSYFDAGGLLWYGADVAEHFHGAATYVERILKGAKPAELPIERPARLFLAVNVKLAGQLGIDLSPGFLARADEVVE